MAAPCHSWGHQQLRPGGHIQDAEQGRETSRKAVAPWWHANDMQTGVGGLQSAWEPPTHRPGSEQTAVCTGAHFTEVLREGSAASLEPRASPSEPLGRLRALQGCRKRGPVQERLPLRAPGKCFGAREPKTQNLLPPCPHPSYEPRAPRCSQGISYEGPRPLQAEHDSLTTTQPLAWSGEGSEPCTQGSAPGIKNPAVGFPLKGSNPVSLQKSCGQPRKRWEGLS